jgi:hypothetical protein
VRQLLTVYTIPPISRLLLRSLLPQSGKCTLLGYCTFTRYKTWKHLAASELSEWKRHEKIVGLPVPPHQQIADFLLLLWIIQELQNCAIKAFRVRRGV